MAKAKKEPTELRPDRGFRFERAVDAAVKGGPKPKQQPKKTKRKPALKQK